MMEIVFFLAGLFAGTLLVGVWAWLGFRGKDNLIAQLREEQIQAAPLKSKVEGLEKEKTSLLQELERVRERMLTAKTLQVGLEKDVELLGEKARRLEDLEKESRELKERLQEREINLNRVTVEKQALQEETERLKDELIRLKDHWKNEFENIAQKILKQSSSDLTRENQQQLNAVLNPLKERIFSFEKRVEDTYEKGVRDQLALQEEVRKLTELNTLVSREAHNLTRALKSDVKQQGNWGEMILEKILERSGLTKGSEFDREVVINAADGHKIRPDVVVYLPDDKHVIVDSKVSLNAYERLVNADSAEERQKYVKEHILSVRNHVKELSQKSYYNGQGLNSPEFVLMFVPVESSFAVAVQEDHSLFQDAWDRKVVIVSPSTLLATLQTIAAIWRQENQTKNALEIAKQSGALYDKFVGFVEDLEKIGKTLSQAQDVYGKAVNKLYQGKGNLVKRAESIKKLGANTGKTIPGYMVEASEIDIQEKIEEN